MNNYKKKFDNFMYIFICKKKIMSSYQSPKSYVDNGVNNMPEMTTITIEPDTLYSTEASGSNTKTFATWNQNYDVVYKPRKNKSSDDGMSCIAKVCFCFGYFTLIGLMLGILAGGIAYYVFGIKYLVKNYDESEKCNSSIGDYVITSLILSWILAGGQSQSLKSDDVAIKVWTNTILGFAWIGVGIWGFLITKDEQCDDILNTPLWRFAKVISIIQLSLGTTSVFITIGTIIFVIIISK